MWSINNDFVIYTDPDDEQSFERVTLKDPFNSNYSLLHTLKNPYEYRSFWDELLSDTSSETFDSQEVSSSAPSSTPSTVTVTSNADSDLEKQIIQYWSNGAHRGGTTYTRGETPIYQLLYNRGLITRDEYTHEKNQHPRVGGNPNSFHKLGYFDLGNGNRTLHAYDFSPVGNDYTKFLTSVYNDKDLVNYLLSHGLGILEEFESDFNLGGRAGGRRLKAKTKASGDHTHWGPDVKARAYTLVRLKKAGYPVPDNIYNEALKRITR